MDAGDDALETGHFLVFLWNGLAVLQDVIAVTKILGLLEAELSQLAVQVTKDSLPLGLKAFYLSQANLQI